MTERYGFSFSQDDPASRRGPGVTGPRHDEPESPQRADVREIDLTEDDEDERDLAAAEAAERVERLREAARDVGGGDGPATAVFPPAGDRQEEDEEDEEDEDAVPGGAPRPFTVGAPARAFQDDEDDEPEEASGPAPATVDISEVAEVEAEDEEAAGGMALAPATPSPRSGEAGAAEVEGAEPQDGQAARANPAPRSGALLATDAAAVRRQFLDIQAGFVDEPRQAVEQAGELVEELHKKVLQSLDSEREHLGDALDAEEATTEDLRVALRAYRAYVDRLLGLHL